MPPRKLARTEPTATPIPIAIRRYRVLFSDGATVDFLSYSDHSGIRGEMLDAHFGPRPKNAKDDHLKKIEGIADLGVVYTHVPMINPLHHPDAP